MEKTYSRRRRDMAYQIKRWDNGKVIHEHGKTAKECLEHGIKNGVIFNHASLNGASLNRASLNDALLNRASLNGASLNHASLNHASLNHASLYGASLYGASLNHASLNGALLYGASLNDASGIYFSKFDMHIAYATSAGILIGCKWHSVNHWLKNYKEIGRNSEYSEIQIEMYGAWIKIVAENLKRQL